MSARTRPNLAALAVILLALALVVTAAVGVRAQDDDEPTEEPTEEATDEPVDEETDEADEPDEEPTDEPSEEATDEPDEEPTDEPDSLTDTGLAMLLEDGQIDADGLYTAFLQYLVAEYDSEVVVEDDVLSIQIPLDALSE